MPGKQEDFRLVYAWNSGASVEQLARDLGVQPQSVRVSVQRAAKRLGVKLARPRSRTAPDPAPPCVPPEPRWFERERPGRMRAAVDRVLADVGGSAPVPAELARDLADLVDSARERQDPKLWLAASARLEALLNRMHGTGPTPPPPDPVSDPIGDALGSGPE